MEQSVCTGDRRTGCWKMLEPSRELGSRNTERLAGNCFAEGLGKEALRLRGGKLARVKRSLQSGLGLQAE